MSILPPTSLGVEAATISQLRKDIQLRIDDLERQQAEKLNRFGVDDASFRNVVLLDDVFTFIETTTHRLYCLYCFRAELDASNYERIKNILDYNLLDNLSDAILEDMKEGNNLRKVS